MKFPLSTEALLPVTRAILNTSFATEVDLRPLRSFPIELRTLLTHCEICIQYASKDAQDAIELGVNYASTS